MPRKTKKEVMSLPEASKKLRVNISVQTLIMALLLVLALGAAGYFYYQTKHPEKLAQEQEKEDLVKELSQFLDLPANETPTLATVTDREKLAEQPFFAKAENGDKVLIYSESGKAILYRPSTKKVIDMTSTDVQKPEAASEATPEVPTTENASEEELTPRQDLTVTLLNGSTKSAVTTPVEQEITENLQNYTVEKKVSANKKDYQGIIIVDGTGNQAERAQELATLLGGKVEAMPEGESATTDIVIIVGN